MKNLFIIILTVTCLTATNLLFGQSVNIGTAKDIATNFLLNNEKINLKSTRTKQFEYQVSYASSAIHKNDTLYFVLNDTLNNSFVIIAADRRSWPILGYSSEGIYHFENLPPAFTEWMENIQQQIIEIKDKNLLPGAENSQQWESLSKSDSEFSFSATSVGPLIQTQWNQGCFYNAQCPEDAAGSCGHTFTGCNATAMAQIMRYWNFPTTGTGSHSYTHDTYGIQTADFGSTTYQWTLMPNNVTSPNAAVAQLNYHCAVSLEMDFGPDGSSSFMSQNALIDYFSYDQSATMVERSNHSTEGWSNLIKYEGNNGRVVWYRGADSDQSTAHAFICDGYQNTDYFHFNWGWGGTDDGYFYIDNLNPGSHQYNDSQMAIIRIFPTDLPDGYNGFFLSDNVLYHSGKGGDQSVRIISSADWTASSNQSWLTLSQETGTSGNTELVVTAEENNTGSERSANVTVSVNGFDSQIITIHQYPVYNINAGELSTTLSGILSTAVDLSLEGTIDARDFKTMRDEMPRLTKIDLTGVDIVAYTGTEGTNGNDNQTYPANTIPERAFNNATTGESKENLVSIMFPASATAIGDFAFIYCSGLSVLSLPPMVTSIGLLAFSFCDGLTNFFITETVTDIDYYAFMGSSALLTVSDNNADYSSQDGLLFNKDKNLLICCPVSKTGSLTILSTVTSIRAYAFYNCRELTSLEIPELVTSIGRKVFFNCSGLNSIYAYPIIPVNLNSSEGVFSGVDQSTCILYIPQGSITPYQAENQWKDFTTIIELPVIRFNSGWNIASFSNLPTNSDIQEVFQPLISDEALTKIQDEAGNTLEDWGIYGGLINNIGNISHTEGYKVKVMKDCQLMISGITASFPFQIPLKAGWNIIGYPQTESFNGMDIIQPLIDNGSLIKVQDEAGNSIEDWGVYGGWQNNIGDFIPEEGYKVKVNADDILWIYNNYTKSKSILPLATKAVHFKPVFKGNGVDHMNFNLINLPANILQAGDELAIYDGTTCVGAVAILQNFLNWQTVSIAASASDNQRMAGFVEGNPISFKLWKSGNNQEFNLEPEIVKGTTTFAKQETTFASLEKYIVTGLEGLVNSELPDIKCYPNPFGDEITIEINLSRDAEVQVEVMDQMGQRINTLATGGILNRGIHRLSWNGRNNSNNQVSSGIYYVRVMLGNDIYFKKVIYSKRD